MQVILQFCLIAILVEEAFSSGVCYDHYACVKFVNSVEELKIPDNNPMIKGEKDDAHDSWYTYVNWLEKPASNLTVLWRVWYWDGYWERVSKGELDVYAEGKLEQFVWAKLVGKALGLHASHGKIPGKVRVPRNLFSGDKCIGVNFKTPWKTGIRYSVYLDVVDKAENVFLTGRIDRVEE